MSYFFKNNNFISLSETKTLEDRLAESNKVLIKYPERIPIIVEPFTDDIVKIDKNKFIVSKDMTFGQLIYIIRKRININSDIALFFSINGVLCPLSTDIESIYNDNKSEDNFLYVKYTTENTFG